MVRFVALSCYLYLIYRREEAGYLRERGARVQAVQRRKKRKAKARAYVVFVGRVPGVYEIWYVPVSILFRQLKYFPGKNLGHR